MPKILVDADKYLEYLMKEHQPKTYDIGDQREPYTVIVCICMEYKAIPKNYSTNNVYTKHLIDILNKDYYPLLRAADTGPYYKDL